MPLTRHTQHVVRLGYRCDPSSTRLVAGHKLFKLEGIKRRKRIAVRSANAAGVLNGPVIGVNLDRFISLGFHRHLYESIQKHPTGWQGDMQLDAACFLFNIFLTIF